jgi:hypothetical protein
MIKPRNSCPAFIRTGGSVSDIQASPERFLLPKSTEHHQRKQCTNNQYILLSAEFYAHLYPDKKENNDDFYSLDNRLGWKSE